MWWLAMMLQVAGPTSPAVAMAGDYERCMLAAGDRLVSAPEPAEAIARAARTSCGPIENRMREAALASARPEWTEAQRRQWQVTSDRINSAYADGMQDRVALRVIERRARR